MPVNSGQPKKRKALNMGTILEGSEGLFLRGAGAP